MLHPSSQARTAFGDDGTPQGYAGARRRVHPRRTALLVVLAIVVPQLILLAVLATGLGVVPMGAGRSASAQPKAADAMGIGQCVRLISAGKDPTYAPVECADGQAYGTVIAVVENDPDATEACPAESDLFAYHDDDVLCVLRLGDAHPGQPGHGGGVYRPGDCVASDEASGVREIACDSGNVFETVTARVRTVAECRAPATRFATLQHGRTRVLCLADGPHIAGPGQCLADPFSPPLTFRAVPCDGPEANATVLARVTSAADCQRVAGQTHYVDDPSGLPASRVVCLRVFNA